MLRTVSRGYVPQDARQFNDANIRLLQTAQKDLVYLLDRHYPMQQTVTFIGNRFQFSTRQRTALMRASSSTADLRSRRSREQAGRLPGETLYIDGFNLIITLEAALSGSTILFCMDGCIRDLCGLHGTYRLIDKTDCAIRLIDRQLERLQIKHAVFILDRQISNSGRLKQRIIELAADFAIRCDVLLMSHADSFLTGMPIIVTSDSGILDHCEKWVNLAYSALKKCCPSVLPVNLSAGSDW